MKDQPLVSVVVPAFNSEQFLGQCLRSVRAQTYPNIEVIVVDNYSTDRTRKIAESYEAKILETEAKRSEARNLGTEEASGDLVLFVDSDMELDPSVIDECVKKIREGYDGIIIPEVSVGQGFWARCKALEKACYIGDGVIEAARLFERRILEIVGGYDQKLEAGEDWDLDLRISKAGYRIGRINAFIKHQEGKLSLQETILKKHYYGKTLERYRLKHPKEAKQQLRLIRPAFFKNWRKLVQDPIHASGMLFMKTCEFGAGGIGYLKSKSLFQNKGHEEFLGRLKVIQGLMSKGRISLSVGCKETRLADMNIDIDPSVNSDMIADVRSLPFRNDAFQQVLFADVIEHLPKGGESKALQEIHRVLCNRGELILTTPHSSALYTLLDLAGYMTIHRHYKKELIKDLLKCHRFEIEKMFTAGGLWAGLSNLWYCLITYPVKKILNYRLSYAPLFMQVREDQEYNIIRQNGYTVFIRARKKGES